MTDGQAAVRPTHIPTGTVTLLFTDIEASTQHWEERRDAMAEALRRHDELIRSAIDAHGGYVFKTVGDAFCATFWSASNAVGAAAEAQRAIESSDWSAIGELKVRMALHSGANDERDGDYFGPTVNRTARLLAVAHGGQVVVSEATALLLRGMVPERMELRDLGEHRLKDLVDPEHVWQLTAPGLAKTFPPLRSLESLPNNLPRQVTPLIGREDVLAELEPLVLEHPLVTIVGTGGIGKTRVALQVGADLLDGAGDGVWFIDLAPLSDPALVVSTIASTFGLREQGERPMLDVLLQYLRPRRLLLILDNCEHVIEEAARVTDAIARTAPQVRLLATSREPLRIAAERIYRLPSLAVPPELSPTAQDALRYGAVALFVDRAIASDAKFALTDQSAPIVAEICRRLDGIALAIELAAARVKVFAPRELAQKLDERFRVLTGGSRTALPRQQTMRALIDWSYELLSEPEQRLFRRLAIFVDGWTVEAAEAVTSDETLDALDTIDLMSSLVEKSLVVAETADGRMRYRLLESTRAFALEKLEQSGERDALARRHAQWAADLADRADNASWTEPTSHWNVEYRPEFDNARSATAWALANGEVTLAARILAGFVGFYGRLGMHAELRRRHDAVLGN
ncbi:MAG: adenylate/guanylate cyclase domain-containing protein, partial [Candidatus Eremiobacteraeota bacterium]|nr:adenylate/guanylate cyclase domain-containing protein [Candidatus Eremiobacteraeota bacterium]